jgi:cell division protein ZapA (FtsZ GTPase activity inhibitor)
MANELCLEILGTKFTITVEEDEEYLQEIFSQYRAAVANTQNISGIKDPLNAAVLTGFLLCDEINKLRLRQGDSDEEQEAEERARNLILRLDQTLEKISGENELS